ncbi:hypothetical protein [Sphingomonas alpina]|uniref:Uncharacterized protein n=1 Tax=Sphingomonas alpina TaxID=653931 RepID=A0A7H0LEL0_9SPHN|nr:hypothetical protein [Sphingomonas alpina]QNQ08113.1 hypothetical protein H3Z74_15200 [Sphingomonas alpina]
MDGVITVIALILIGLAVVPWLLVGLGTLASQFDLAITDRILTLAARSVQLQWIGGSMLNIVAGLALAALGIWAVLHVDPLLDRLSGVSLVPFGLWRISMAAALLRHRPKSSANVGQGDWRPPRT